jgi:excisionase family DNA binding protein
MKKHDDTEGPLPPWLSPNRAAIEAGVNRKTIYRRIEAGSLPAVRFGPRCIRIRREDLLALLTPGAHNAAKKV